MCTANKAPNNESNINMNEKSEQSSSSSSSIPAVLKPWIQVYRAVPKSINIPFTQTSMSFSLVCALYLLVWRLFLGRFLIYIGWPDSMQTIMVSENISAIVHSMHLCPLLLILLLKYPFRPAGPITDHSQWWQDGANAMIELCTGYMIYDAVCSLLYRNYILTPGAFSIHLPAADWCFLGHHIATVLYMSSSRINKAGHMSAMWAMFLGEVTNPVQNTMLSFDEAMKLGDCCAGSFILTFYPYVRFAYGLLYAMFRIVFGPVAFAYTTFVCLFTKEGRANVPLALSLLWVSLLWGITYGSIPWMQEAIEIVQKAISNPDEAFRSATFSQEL